MIALAALNGLPEPEFVRELAGIFEHSPWVAARAAAGRPFVSRAQLLGSMCDAVQAASTEEQLALIRAHPRLGLRGRARNDLTRSSSEEQRGAGLDAVAAEDLARLDALNAAYFHKFAMPFIIAVRGHTPESIIAACQQRLGNDARTEHRIALEQIGVIAGHRLVDAVSDTDPTA